MSIEIVPAIDLIDEKCVRLIEGEYSKKTVYGCPLKIAKSYQLKGAKRLHLVDLDGAEQKEVIHWKVIKAISEQTNLSVDFGGGVRSDEDLERLFDLGVDKVTAGSLAVQNPRLVRAWIERYGADKIILGADEKNGKIAIDAWKEDSGKDLCEFIKVWMRDGINHVISTDVLKDGMMNGPSIPLYRTLRENFPELTITASGGVTTVKDIIALNKLGVQEAIVGTAILKDPKLLEQMIKEGA